MPNNKVRVLNVISSLNNAGTEAVVINYFRLMDKNSIQFDFMVLDEKSDYYQNELLGYGCNIYRIPNFKSNPLKNIKLRKKIIKEGKYDIVEVHSPSAERYAYCKLAKRYGSYSIFHIHNTDFRKKNFILKFFQRQVIKYSDQIVTCSQFAANTVIGRNADGIVYNAINYDRYKFIYNNRMKIRKYYGLKDTDLLIGNVGRFSTQKNHLFLLRVFNELVKKKNNVYLLLKGFGEERENIENYIKNNKLGDKVIIEENYLAEELYSSFDLYAVPSIFEGLAVTLIEAQTNGLPIVVSSNTTKEAMINKNVIFADLVEDNWLKLLSDNSIYNRIKFEYVDLVKSRYDIVTESKLREEFYLSHKMKKS